MSLENIQISSLFNQNYYLSYTPIKEVYERQQTERLPFIIAIAKHAFFRDSYNLYDAHQSEYIPKNAVFYWNLSATSKCLEETLTQIPTSDSVHIQYYLTACRADLISRDRLNCQKSLTEFALMRDDPSFIFWLEALYNSMTRFNAELPSMKFLFESALQKLTDGELKWKVLSCFCASEKEPSFLTLPTTKTIINKAAAKRLAIATFILRSKDIQTAFDYLNGYLKKNPEDIYVNEALGIRLYEQGDTQAAKAYLKTALSNQLSLKVTPELPDSRLYSYLGSIMVKNKEITDDAQLLWKELGKFIMSYLKLYITDENQALGYFCEYFYHHPDAVDTAQFIKLLNSFGCKIDTEKYHHATRKIKLNTPGIKAFENSEYKEARIEFDKVYSRCPTMVSPYYGQLLMLNQEFTKAKEYYTNSLLQEGSQKQLNLIQETLKELDTIEPYFKDIKAKIFANTYENEKLLKNIIKNQKLLTKDFDTELLLQAAKLKKMDSNSKRVRDTFITNLIEKLETLDSNYQTPIFLLVYNLALCGEQTYSNKFLRAFRDLNTHHTYGNHPAQSLCFQAKMCTCFALLYTQSEKNLILNTLIYGINHATTPHKNSTKSIEYLKECFPVTRIDPHTYFRALVAQSENMPFELLSSTFRNLELK